MTATASANVASFTYRTGTGWDTPILPGMDSANTLVVAFGSPNVSDMSPAIKDLRDAYPNSHLIGCSTAGEIHGTTLLDDSLAVGVMQFSHTRLASVSREVTGSDDARGIGQAIGAALAGDGLRAVFVLSDGTGVNGSELVRGLSEELPEGVTITGGLAADGCDFKSTWVVEQGAASSGVVTAVGFYGDRFRIGHGSKGGWDVFGPQRIVTRSEANVLYEVDGQPALPLYKRYLGERASELPGAGLLFPLAILKDRHDSDPIVRTILNVNHDDDSITFAGDVPQGCITQLMRANFDRLIEGASDSAQMTRRTNSSSAPSLCIAISCVGRRLVLGARTEEELERIEEVLPKGSTLVGFYSYGEISPLVSGSCDLHNQTMTLTTISEI